MAAPLPPNLLWHHRAFPCRTLPCPPAQFAGVRLRSLACQLAEGRQAAEVTLEQLSGSFLLAPVLQALLPPRVALHSLDLKGGPQPEALEGCPQLAQVQRLRLDLCFCPGHAAVAALLRQAPAVRELELHMCFGSDQAERGRLPPAVVAYPGLRALRLIYMSMNDLPEGPYLLGEPAEGLHPGARWAGASSSAHPSEPRHVPLG